MNKITTLRQAREQYTQALEKAKREEVSGTPSSWAEALREYRAAERAYDNAWYANGLHCGMVK